MNHRQQRRAAGGKVNQADLAPTIINAAHYLTYVTASTATGATLFMPDGERKYMSIATARAIAANVAPKGEKQ